MSKRGYTDENGEWVDYMSKAEAKSSAEELGKMADFFMKEELKELRKDRLRLEWMIENPDAAVVKHNGSWTVLHVEKLEEWTFKSPRAAIDAALKQERKNEK